LGKQIYLINKQNKALLIKKVLFTKYLEKERNRAFLRKNIFLCSKKKAGLQKVEN